MVQVLLLAGLVAGVIYPCGWCREELVSLALTGDSWGFVNRPFPSTQGTAKSFISIQTLSLSDQQGAEMEPRNGALRQMRAPRPRDLYP